MDTRRKIVTPPEAPVGAVFVTGEFDILGVEQVRALNTLANRAEPVIAVVLPHTATMPLLLSQHERAEMAGALRMVDFVLIAASPGSPGDLQELVNRLKPAEIIALEEAEAQRKRRLIKRIQHGAFH